MSTNKIRNSKKTVMTPNMKQLRKLIWEQTILFEEETEDIASSEEEYYKAYRKSDRTEAVIQEPVLKKSSDKSSDIDWKAIDPFDRVFGIQCNGHDSSMDGLHETPKTP